MESTGQINKAKILVVDDEEIIRIVMKRVLADDGYTVLEAANGQEAFEIYNHNRPALVTLDLLMPVMDGFQFLRKIGEQGARDCPVIVITGHGHKEEEQQSMELGARAFLKKPFSVGEFRKIVRGILLD